MKEEPLKFCRETRDNSYPATWESEWTRQTAQSLSQGRVVHALYISGSFGDTLQFSHGRDRGESKELFTWCLKLLEDRDGSDVTISTGPEHNEHQCSLLH